MDTIAVFSLVLFIAGRDCLFPATNVNGHTMPPQCINSTNSTVFVTWYTPSIAYECRDELVAFPTLLYIVFFTENTMGTFFAEVSILLVDYMNVWMCLCMYVCVCVCMCVLCVYIICSDFVYATLR